MKNRLDEHKNFRNQCIAGTILLICGGVFLSLDLPGLREEASEGAVVLFGFGFIMSFVAIFNVITFEENKKDYEKLTGKKYK